MDARLALTRLAKLIESLLHGLNVGRHEVGTEVGGEVSDSRARLRFALKRTEDVCRSPETLALAGFR